MTEIVRKPGFLPEATWLVPLPAAGRAAGPSTAARSRASATRPAWGPSRTWASRREHRNRGLGTALLLRAHCRASAAPACGASTWK